MSMFFFVDCRGKYDAKNKIWDDGIITMFEPEHMTRADINNIPRAYVKKKPNLDKSTCEQVQEIYLEEKDGKRKVYLIVKAMGYLEAKERAKKFCDQWYKPRKTPKSKQVSAKELFNSLPKAISKANSLVGGLSNEFEYYGVWNERIFWK